MPDWDPGPQDDDERLEPYYNDEDRDDLAEEDRLND